MRIFLLVPLVLFALQAFAQDTPPPAPVGSGEDPAHSELRQTRATIIEAIESRDIARMLELAHPDIVVTWQNGEVCHGADELRAFYDRMGEDAFVAFKIPHEADRLSVLHGGDTAVAAGHVVADYHLLGKAFEFDSRWTATLVRVDDRWLVSAYHVSLNALDNPILGAAKSALWIGIAIAGIIGFALGALVMRRRKSKSIAE